MTAAIEFRCYEPRDSEACLAIFDENCPAYFAQNERDDYAGFLDSMPNGYEVCILDGSIVGAFGLVSRDQGWGALNWILISPAVQRSGIGSQLMRRVVNKGDAAELVGVKIAASHLSAPFFAKHGATRIRETRDGWGVGMHRVDMELML